MVSAKWITGGSDNIKEVRRILEKNVPPELLKYITQAQPDAKYIAVYSGGTLAAAGILDIAVINNEAAMIGPVAVSEAYRRQGLGGLIMRMMIRRAYERGYSRHFVTATEETAGFFESLGFIGVSTQKDSLIRMEREGDVGGECG